MSVWTSSEKSAYRLGIDKGRRLQREDDLATLRDKRASADDIDRLIAAVERLIEKKGKK